MSSRAAVSVLLAATASAQTLATPPSFDEPPAFRKGSASPIDSSSHISGRAEAAASQVASQIERFVPASPARERERFEGAHGLLRQGHLAAAAEAFDKSAGAFPESGSLLAGAAITRFLTGRYDAAAEAILTLVRRAPRDPRLIPLLGETAAAVPLARRASYTAALRKFAAAFPALGEPRFYLGQLLAASAAESTETPAEAIALWVQAAHLDRRDARPCLELARAAAATAKPERAIEWLAQALARDPNLPDAHFRLSRLYAKEGDAARAAQHLERYRQLRAGSQ